MQLSHGHDQHLGMYVSLPRSGETFTMQCTLSDGGGGGSGIDCSHAGVLRLSVAGGARPPLGRLGVLDGRAGRRAASAVPLAPLRSPPLQTQRPFRVHAGHDGLLAGGGVGGAGGVVGRSVGDGLVVGGLVAVGAGSQPAALPTSAPHRTNS